MINTILTITTGNLHAPPLSDLNVFFHEYFWFKFMREHFSFVLGGFFITLKLSFISAILSLAWGLILAVMRQSRGRGAAPIRLFAIGYIDVFRGIPLLLIILLVSGGWVPVTEGVGLPKAVQLPDFLGGDYRFWYAVVSLTICYGAYMAEVYRAGIEAVPRGQMEAARSLGMSHGQAMRHVIVPQAIRKVIPPLLNDFIALTKDTSLAYVIALDEVVDRGHTLQATYLNSSALTLGAIFFVLFTIPLARIVDRLIAGQQSRYMRSSPN